MDLRRATSMERIDVALWLSAFACGLVTLWLSLWAVPPGTTAFGGADKVEHGLAYFVTALLLLLAAVWRPGRGDGPLARWWWGVLAGLVVAGGMVELIQTQVGREGEWKVWFAEIVAVALAWAAIWVVRAWDVRGAR
jgi:hypothetical protein